MGDLIDILVVTADLFSESATQLNNHAPKDSFQANHTQHRPSFLGVIHSFKTG